MAYSQTDGNIYFDYKQYNIFDKSSHIFFNIQIIKIFIFILFQKTIFIYVYYNIILHYLITQSLKCFLNQLICPIHICIINN